MIARVTGKCRYVAKIYESIAAEANMEAKVKRHAALWTATFLSRFFVPHSDSKHLTVPILGKALGRFNMRANANQAVSNELYMACKSVGYAYEFRYVPVLRDVFLERFKFEWAATQDKKRSAMLEAQVSWNAKQVGVTLKNITQKIRVDEVLSEYDFNAFCFERYELSCTDVVDLFRQVVISNEMIDIEGIVGLKLAQDFL